MSEPLARCTEPSCPFRWRSGPDRPCAEHAAADGIADAAAMLGIDLLMSPPGEHETTTSDTTEGKNR